MKKYYKYLIIFFIILVLGILASLNFRYQINEVEVYEGKHECLIRTDSLTGKSCLIGGSQLCNLSSHFGKLEKCYEVTKK